LKLKSHFISNEFHKHILKGNYIAQSEMSSSARRWTFTHRKEVINYDFKDLPIC